MSLRRKRTITATPDGVECPLCRRVVPQGEEAGRCVLGHPLPATDSASTGDRGVAEPASEELTGTANEVGMGTARLERSADPYDELFETTAPSADPYVELRDVDPLQPLRPAGGPTWPTAEIAGGSIADPDGLSALELLARGESPFGTSPADAPPSTAPSASAMSGGHADGLRLPLPPGTPAPATASPLASLAGVLAFDLDGGGGAAAGALTADEDAYAHPLDGLLGYDTSPASATGTATAVQARPAQPVTAAAEALLEDVTTTVELAGAAAILDSAADADEPAPDADPTSEFEALDESDPFDDAVALFAAPDGDDGVDEAAEDARHARRRTIGIVVGALTAASAVGGAAAVWFLV